MREREEGEVQEARQRASIKWLVAKAYNNSPPREFVDPFYKDYKDVERLKPHLVHALGRYTCHFRVRGIVWLSRIIEERLKQKAR